jgi:hypothetical protein
MGGGGDETIKSLYLKKSGFSWKNLSIFESQKRLQMGREVQQRGAAPDPKSWMITLIRD